MKDKELARPRRETCQTRREKSNVQTHGGINDTWGLLSRLGVWLEPAGRLSLEGGRESRVLYDVLRSWDCFSQGGGNPQRVTSGQAPEQMDTIRLKTRGGALPVFRNAFLIMQGGYNSEHDNRLQGTKNTSSVRKQNYLP